MSKKELGKLLAGIGIGVGIGMLISPKSGKENREFVKTKAKAAAKKVKEVDLNEMKDNLVNGFNNLKEEIKDMDAAKAKKIASKKAKELMESANNLISAAKEKSAPVVEKTAKDVKKKLSEMLADWSERLED